jgi:CheY-like chemotaxis protein
MDDEMAIRKFLQRLLTSLGYEVDLVEEGRAAVRRYVEALKQGRPYDAVILDLTVARGTGGREAISELRKIDPEVRAMVSSGYSNDPVMARYKDYGFRACLPKPYGAAILSRILAELTRRGPQ